MKYLNYNSEKLTPLPDAILFTGLPEKAETDF